MAPHATIPIPADRSLETIRDSPGPRHPSLPIRTSAFIRLPPRGHSATLSQGKPSAVSPVVVGDGLPERHGDLDRLTAATNLVDFRTISAPYQPVIFTVARYLEALRA